MLAPLKGLFPAMLALQATHGPGATLRVLEAAKLRRPPADADEPGGPSTRLEAMVASVHKSADGRGAAAIAAFQAERCDTGLPSRVIRLSAEQPTLASVFWVGRVRAQRRRPMMAL